MSSATRRATTPPPASTPAVIPPPAELYRTVPLDSAQRRTVSNSRHQIRSALTGRDDRLVVVTGPCSLHDPAAAVDYATRLARAADRLADDLIVVMRGYVEKPRTCLGWPGMATDPHLDGVGDIAAGIALARTVLRDIVNTGVPVACEWVNPMIAPYLADLVSWGAIGARTIESPPHRHLAATLPMPVGMKHRRDGDISTAIDAIRVAANPHTVMGVTVGGNLAAVRAPGNPHTHLVLRGGASGPNHTREAIHTAAAALRRSHLPAAVMIDAAHANSGGDHVRQTQVATDLASSIAMTKLPIAGVMLESNLLAGRQPACLGSSRQRVYGQSITDACIGWADTTMILDRLAAAVSARRRRAAGSPTFAAATPA